MCIFDDYFVLLDTYTEKDPPPPTPHPPEDLGGVDVGGLGLLVASAAAGGADAPPRTRGLLRHRGARGKMGRSSARGFPSLGDWVLMFFCGQRAERELPIPFVY